jgi:hypothetical protein
MNEFDKRLNQIAVSCTINGLCEMVGNAHNSFINIEPCVVMFLYDAVDNTNHVIEAIPAAAARFFSQSAQAVSNTLNDFLPSLR